MLADLLNFLYVKASSPSDDAAAFSKLVQVRNLVDCDNIVIFTKSQCSYCKTALELFDRCGAAYTEIVLDRRPDGDEIQTVLGEMTGCRTVPRVFVNSICLGGCSECKRLFDTGKLQELIRDCLRRE